MDIERTAGDACPIALSLEHIGDRWSMLILRNAGVGQTRFDEFQKSLGIAPNILARRLVALTARRLLERRRYTDKPPRDEYLLTKAGRDFLPVLHALGAWGTRHFSNGDVTGLIDATNGQPVLPSIVDRSTGQVLSNMNLRSAPAVTT
jgi:DNA-binding HxlR family transcriptional regulator